MSATLSLTLSSSGTQSLLASLLDATPTALLTAKRLPDSDGTGKDVIVVGCEDGSMYVLHSNEAFSKGNLSIEPVTPTVPSESSSLSPLFTHRHRQSSPRSLSPSSTKTSYSPFQPTKPRVVSSVSADQAEAPKNYVDFDEEQEKMKNLLKRKGVKDRTVMNSLMPGVEKTFASDMSLDSGLPSREGGSDTVSSTPLSPASSTHSISRPSSPTRLPHVVLSKPSEVPPWSLICHIIPPEAARLSPVVSLRVLDSHSSALCLHKSGDASEVGVYSLQDGACYATCSARRGAFLTPNGAKPHSKLPLIWHWKSLHVVPAGETFLIVASASSEATTSTVQPLETESDRTEDTLVALFELVMEGHGDVESFLLTEVGEWTFEGASEGVSLHRGFDDQINLLHVDASQHLIRQRIALSDKSSETESPMHASSSNVHLPLPNPFKALKGLRSSENLDLAETENEMSRVSLTDMIDLGMLSLNGPLVGIHFDSTQSLASGLVWSDQELLLFDVSGLAVQVLGIIKTICVVDVLRHQHNRITVQFQDRIELRKLDASASYNDQSYDPSSSHIIHSEVLQSCSLSDSNIAIITAPSEAIVFRMQDGRPRLEGVTFSSTTRAKVVRVLWKMKRKDAESARNGHVSRLSVGLPLDLDRVILGYTDGKLESSSLTSLLQRKSRGSSGAMSNLPLAGCITYVGKTRVQRTGENRIIAGSDDGSIAIFSQESMQLLARWTVFIEPLQRIISVSKGRLTGCILCISRDGSIALVALDECEFLYLVPASMARLQKICLGEDNLLLTYADKRVRLWDTRTREFWRSMSIEKAEEMVMQGGWEEWSLDSVGQQSQEIKYMTDSAHLPDAGSTILVDLDNALLSSSSGPLNVNIAANATNVKNNFGTKLNYLRSLLSPLLTEGLNADIDQICREKIGIHKALFGQSRSGSVTLYSQEGPRDAWGISSEVSALRAVSVLALLQALLPYEEKSDHLHTISAFYCASIGPIVGGTYQAPSLVLLGRIWLQARASELRLASRQLFEAGVARLPDGEVIKLVDSWQSKLSCSQDQGARDTTTSALALYICGSVAVDKYTLLPSGALTDIAKSISIYLHDEHSPHRALAIDLCSRGFPVWQQYVDAVEILRSLFALATSGRKDTNFNVGQQARNAVLLIASGNSPLFMTTVSMDILQPKSVQHRKSVMQLVIFLIHKKPLVLYSNLPRLVEAVVKSLDPNSNANRDAVLDSATEILGHLVEMYPILDFHGPTQRLAIGTSEGAIIMYDLKTATRLYVLEGHKKRTTACGFSPDGRRLVTLSLEEHTVLIWKVGSSFTSFFMPGAPPRQGHSGSDPYKTYNFNIGDEGEDDRLILYSWSSSNGRRNAVSRYGSEGLYLLSVHSVAI
ncbi:hypothetical protein BDW22DRAFT_1426257 [Trametopsis cervina]|nr:hypothetical protein BDW22DRAFT_1426257 [Trametopsis cervina]